MTPQHHEPNTQQPVGFLSGYRVLDLTDERGLITGRMLADLGADVVQVEPPDGSTARSRVPHAPEGSSLFFDAYAANKRGIVADPDTSEGRELITRLAAVADVIIESADPGAMAARRLDHPDLKELNPRLIYVSITAFGRTGPKSGYVASDLVVWAAGGPLDPHRDGDRPPVRISLPQAFLHAGADAAAGALFALHARHRSGLGQHVDVAAQTSLGIATLGQILATAVGDDKPQWDQARPRVDQSGSGAGTAAAQKKWRCVDGVVEFHIGVGPAVGGFTGAFMRWMVEEGGADAGLLEVDWRSLPARIEDGSFSEADMAAVREAVAAFLSGKTMDEVLFAAMQRKLLCVPVYDTAGVAASSQLAARNFWAEVGDGARRRRIPGCYATVAADAFSIARPAPLLGEHTEEVRSQWLADAPPVRNHTRAERRGATGPATLADPRPMGGLKVLDLTWVVAGPVIGRALADFGATVVRVESSTRVETARHMPPFYGGVRGPENSALYGTWNCGKLGVTVDLSTERGRDVVRRLAAWSDVVVEAFSPGQMSRWGLDYESLSAGREDLIMLSTAIMGQTGPHARLAGYGNVGAALSGFQDIVGWPDRPAFGPFGPYSDYVGPRFSLVALLAALEKRRRTGRGCYLDVSQVEGAVYFQAPEMADYALSSAVVHRVGNADREFAPHGVYPCRDEAGAAHRFVAIAATTDSQWRALAEILARPDLAADPILASATGRRDRAAELDLAIAAWTRDQLAADVEHILQARDIPAHVSASSRDLCNDPQLAHRGHFVRLPHQLHGTAVVEGPRYLLSGTPGSVSRAAPTFGQDNQYVLTGILGFSQDEFLNLTEEGVLR